MLEQFGFEACTVLNEFEYVPEPELPDELEVGPKVMDKLEIGHKIPDELKHGRKFDNFVNR